MNPRHNKHTLLYYLSMLGKCNLWIMKDAPTENTMRSSRNEFPKGLLVILPSGALQ